MKTPTGKISKTKREDIQSNPKVWKKKGLITPVKAEGITKLTSLWLRLGIPILPKEHRVQFLDSMSTAIAAGMKRGKEIKVGFNSVYRRIEKYPLEVNFDNYFQFANFCHNYSSVNSLPTH